MKIPFGKPIIEEEEKEAVMKVLSGPILVHGPKANPEEAKVLFSSLALKNILVLHMLLVYHLVQLECT